MSIRKWHDFFYIEPALIDKSKQYIMIQEHFQECIEACQDCVVACNQCAIACTREPDIQDMANCIRLDLECAAFCNAAVQVMTLSGTLAGELCELCARICLRCAEECEKYEKMDHCRECALVCHKCAEICGQMAEHV